MRFSGNITYLPSLLSIFSATSSTSQIVAKKGAIVVGVMESERLLQGAQDSTIYKETPSAEDDYLLPQPASIGERTAANANQSQMGNTGQEEVSWHVNQPSKTGVTAETRARWELLRTLAGIDKSSPKAQPSQNLSPPNIPTEPYNTLRRNRSYRRRQAIAPNSSGGSMKPLMLPAMVKNESRGTVHQHHSEGSRPGSSTSLTPAQLPRQMESGGLVSNARQRRASEPGDQTLAHLPLPKLPQTHEQASSHPSDAPPYDKPAGSAFTNLQDKSISYSRGQAQINTPSIQNPRLTSPPSQESSLTHLPSSRQIHAFRNEAIPPEQPPDPQQSSYELAPAAGNIVAAAGNNPLQTITSSLFSGVPRVGGGAYSSPQISEDGQRPPIEVRLDLQQPRVSQTPQSSFSTTAQTIPLLPQPIVVTSRSPVPSSVASPLTSPDSTSDTLALGLPTFQHEPTISPASLGQESGTLTPSQSSTINGLQATASKSDFADLLSKSPEEILILLAEKKVPEEFLTSPEGLHWIMQVFVYGLLLSVDSWAEKNVFAPELAGILA